MQQTLRIVSRTSKLALWQAHFVKSQLESLYPFLSITILGVKTEGDKILDISLAKIGGKGLFVKALEDVLLHQEADIAVHSLKDIPAELPEGLTLGAILEREDPTDAFVSNRARNLRSLPPKASVGTSSLRRQAQLLALRPDLCPQVLRGNVDTRLAKLDAEQYDSIIVASSGLKRLGLSHRVTERLSIQQMLPAVAQGALGIECRLEDVATLQLIKPLHHLPSAHCVLAERSLNKALDGGCHLPVAGFAEINAAGLLHLQGMVALANGSVVMKATAEGPPHQAESIGQKVAQQLFKEGAKAIIDAARQEE